MTTLAPFALGAMAMASFVAALFFFRFYRETGDRLFVFFAAAFCLESMNRTLFAFASNPREGDPSLYLLRAFGYSLILVGIWQKNRRP
jgi:hypothetical protein